MPKKLVAESFGTFCLIFAGTGAIVIDSVSGGAVSHVGIALTFGLIVLAMIYTIGDISGAHINPAVTIGFFVARRFEARNLLPYVTSQCAGAFVASMVLRFLFPQSSTLGETLQLQSSGFNALTVQRITRQMPLSHKRNSKGFDQPNRPAPISSHDEILQIKNPPWTHHRFGCRIRGSDCFGTNDDQWRGRDVSVSNLLEVVR
jgi:hypothetical protein